MYFKEYIGWRADLVLSGHVHGGLVRLPFIGGVISPQVRLFPKYDAGLFSEQGYNMVVSRGLGTHSYMPRFFNPPQLLVIKIKPS
jgi:predicted MPP superfamily phosphohydrolase